MKFVKKYIKKNYKYLLLFLCFIIITQYIKTYICFERITGISMSPTYKNGEIKIGIGKFKQDDIKHNSVVIFNNKNTKNYDYIKRVIGLPGDTLIIKNGYVYVNDKKYEEFGDFEQIKNAGIASEKILIPQNCYFVMGDNRNNSKDSRSFGVIKYSDIKYIIK